MAVTTDLKVEFRARKTLAYYVWSLLADIPFLPSALEVPLLIRALNALRFESRVVGTQEWRRAEFRVTLTEGEA